MKFFLAAAFAIVLSTIIPTSSFSSADGLGRHGLKGPTVIVYEDYMDDEETDSAISEQIRDHLKNSNISKNKPLYIIIGKGIADNQTAFDRFIRYLDLKLAGDIIISITEDPSVANNITTLQDNFLDDDDLTSLSLEGFKNLTSIKNNFLAFNKLTSFSARGLENVESIENGFLLNNKLTSFSAKGLENVKSIGGLFLSNNKLASFSAKGLENLISIGSGFLLGNQMLKMVDLRALNKVTSIDHGFLDKCKNIEEILVTKEKEAFFKQHISEEHHKKIIVKS